jgi:hypothetical protein
MNEMLRVDSYRKVPLCDVLRYSYHIPSSRQVLYRGMYIIVINLYKP